MCANTARRRRRRLGARAVHTHCTGHTSAREFKYPANEEGRPRMCYVNFNAISEKQVQKSASPCRRTQ